MKLTRQQLIMTIIITIAFIGMVWYILQSNQLTDMINKVRPEPTPRVPAKVQLTQPTIIYPTNQKPR